MTLASLGHDDIQYWLMKKENRDKILDVVYTSGWPTPFGTMIKPSLFWVSKLEMEYRFKPDYEREVYLDFWEKRALQQRCLRKMLQYRYRTKKQVWSKGEHIYTDDWNDWCDWRWSDNESNATYFREQMKEPHPPEYQFRRQWKDLGKKLTTIKIIWEIKPIVDRLGEILRQLKKYNDYLKDANCTILIYNASKIHKQLITEYFFKENIKVYQLLPPVCTRLEDLDP